MTDHKFTDEEIIKALELHSNKDVACLDKCPYAERHFCGSSMARDALALINRQKASLQEVITLNSKLEAENAKLQRLLDFFEKYKRPQEPKTEAIKEFAQRLIKKCDAPHWCVWMSEIEDLVKEMTEEHDESQNT